MQNVFRCDASTALAKTRQGTVKGYTFAGLTIFKGIPYARARRFHAPEPLEPWEGVREANSYGYVCPLLGFDRPQGELRTPHRYWPMDEDCLNLNLWTPGLDGKKRPVLFWLHGGGFEAGSAIEQKAYNGANMARYGDVVVVTVNHRLNLLGYFDLSDYGEEYENSGNAGGDDIIAALRWVRDNIAVFGGDPDNVTVFGQSGGGAKVTTLLQSPAADGLYARGINMSGVIGPILADATGSGKDLAEALLRELSLSHVKDLETVDFHQMALAYQKVRPALEAEGKNIGGRPHPNVHYLGEPTENGFRKETADIPLLVGSVFGEFTSFMAPPYDKSALSAEEQEAYLRKEVGDEGAGVCIPLFRKAYPHRPIIDLLSLDFLFRGPEIPYLTARRALNHCTWSYLFDVDQPIDGGSTPWHCSDIPYVFHNIDRVPFPHGEGFPAEELQEEIFQRVMAFARTGDPNTDRYPGWLPSDSAAERTLVLSPAPAIRENFDHELIAAWSRYMGPIFQKRMEEIMGNVQH